MHLFYIVKSFWCRCLGFSFTTWGLCDEVVQPLCFARKVVGFYVGLDVWFKSAFFLRSQGIIAWARDFVPWAMASAGSLLLCWETEQTWGSLQYSEVDPETLNQDWSCCRREVSTIYPRQATTWREVLFFILLTQSYNWKRLFLTINQPTNPITYILPTPQTLHTLRLLVYSIH